MHPKGRRSIDRILRRSLIQGFETLAIGLGRGAAKPPTAPPQAAAKTANSFMPNAASARMKELASLVREHRRRYYILDQPTISDAEYDALEAELRALEAAHPNLADPDSPTRRVGAPPVSAFPKVRHTVGMLSLDKSHSAKELQAWEARVRSGLAPDARPIFSADLKIDGLSLALRYEGRRLVRALTRGDGDIGEDVTENARAIADIPLALPPAAPERLEVRGEVFLSRRRWEELNRQRDAAGETRFASPRQAASGTMKLLDSREVARRRLAFLPWQVLGAEDHTEAMRRLETWGFAAMPARVQGDLPTVLAFIERQRVARPKLPFDTDGIVLKVNALAHQMRLGATERVPRWAIAFKYPSTQATSTLLDITWQVGRSGRLTPVAELEAVELGGSTVRRATLHNPDELARLGVRIGCRLFLEKGGDVIPRVVAVVPDSIPPNTTAPALPTVCPACGGFVGREESRDANLRCLSTDCMAKREARLRHLASRSALNIAGLGHAQAAQLAASGRFQQPWDIFDLLQESDGGVAFLAGLERMSESRARKLADALRTTQTKPLARWILALGIPGVGKQTAERLAVAFPSLKHLWAAEDAALKNTAEAGLKLAESIRTFVALHPDLPARLSELGIKPTS